MVTALGIGALAAALACLPGPPGRGRLHALDERGPGRGGRFRRPGPLLIAPACGVAGALLLGPVGGLCAAAGAAVVHRRRSRAGSSERAARAGAELADALARIADELRTGAHPAAALAGVRHDGPLAHALLAPAEAAARLGEPVPAALRRAATPGRATTPGRDATPDRGPAPGRDAASGPDGVPSAELERVAAAWELADRYGAPLADLLGAALDDVRRRLAHASRVRAQLAGPRATATVLTALPLLGVGLGQLMGTDPVGVLRDGPLGQSLLLAGCVLTAAGTLWSDRILRSAVVG